jgi:hypothetical protein
VRTSGAPGGAAPSPHRNIRELRSVGTHWALSAPRGNTSVRTSGSRNAQPQHRTVASAAAAQVGTHFELRLHQVEAPHRAHVRVAQRGAAPPPAVASASCRSGRHARSSPSAPRGNLSVHVEGSLCAALPSTPHRGSRAAAPGRHALELSVCTRWQHSACARQGRGAAHRQHPTVASELPPGSARTLSSPSAPCQNTSACSASGRAPSHRRHESRACRSAASAVFGQARIEGRSSAAPGLTTKDTT